MVSGNLSGEGKGIEFSGVINLKEKDKGKASKRGEKKKKGEVFNTTSMGTCQGE